MGSARMFRQRGPVQFGGLALRRDIYRLGSAWVNSWRAKKANPTHSQPRVAAKKPCGQRMEYSKHVLCESNRGALIAASIRMAVSISDEACDETILFASLRGLSHSTTDLYKWSVC